MSRRQPDTNDIATSKAATLPDARFHFSQKRREPGRPDLKDATIEIFERRGMLGGHLRNGARLQPLEKAARAGWIVVGIGRKYDQEEAIFGSQRKAGHVEYGMIGHGQAVERQHAEYGGDSGKQNRHLERNHNECGPGMQGLAADVDRIVNGGHPVLHQVAGEAANKAANQHDQRNLIVLKTNFLGQALDGKRAVGVDPLVTRLVRLSRGLNQSGSRIELRHDSVRAFALHSLTSASGRRVRISKIEIMGSKRTKRKIAARNMPMVPM